MSIIKKIINPNYFLFKKKIKITKMPSRSHNSQERISQRALSFRERRNKIFHEQIMNIQEEKKKSNYG